MPEEMRGSTTMRTPRLRQLDHALGIGALAQALEALQRHLQRQIAGREDVFASEREEQIDLRTPAADALDLDELGDRVLIRHRLNADKIDAAGDEIGGETKRVRRFLARE